ncbi:hypothetical protein [Corynebacterium sp.]|uniref:hypothetical protein n=1 Tax=Corynebacterium sp. TaxID=1720 RepID=UPI0028AE13CF|nr:hypothetical protein [Corynebacterium sp.]
MSIDIAKLYAQRAESTGVAGDQVAFTFGGKEFHFTDPLMLSDDEKDELAETEGDIDVAIFYLGEEQYADLVKTSEKVKTADGKEYEIHGGSNVFFLAFSEHQQRSIEVQESGKASRQNRSSRRMAERKQRKQR